MISNQIILKTMNNKKFWIGTLVGGVAFFILGFLIYALALDSFMQNHAGTATGVMKTEMQYWPLILGNFALAALFSYIFLKWAHIESFASGMRAAIIIGLLMSLSYDLVMYDTTNIMDLTGAIVDIIAFSIMSGIGGGIIGLVVGMGRKTATQETS